MVLVTTAASNHCLVVQVQAKFRIVRKNSFTFSCGRSGDVWFTSKPIEKIRQRTVYHNCDYQYNVSIAPFLWNRGTGEREREGER